MNFFSERYGYIKPSEVLIREQMPLEIQNAICNCYDRLRGDLLHIDYAEYSYTTLEKYLWTYFLNNRESEFCIGCTVATEYIEDTCVEWFRKLDLIEFTIKYLYEKSKIYGRSAFDHFVRQLNQEFERLNFAYRIIDTEIVEVSSKEEITAIEEALQTKQSNIRLHLNKALELYSKRPLEDYSNSIKESVSAVEAYCREKTGKATLGEALNELQHNGLIVPKLLNSAFEKLYAYTNQPDTGIRHALMDKEGTYTPGSAEALFMMVSCCSFINYLNKKRINNRDL